LNRQKILRIVGVLVTVCILATSAIVWAVSAKKETINSNISSSAAYEFLNDKTKPSVVMFYAPWCTYCKHFLPTYNALSKTYKGKYNFAMIDGDNAVNADIAKEYAIGSYPTIYIIDPALDNRVLLNNTIYGDVGKIKGELDRYLRIRNMIHQQ